MIPLLFNVDVQQLQVAFGSHFEQTWVIGFIDEDEESEAVWLSGEKFSLVDVTAESLSTKAPQGEKSAGF